MTKFTTGTLWQMVGNSSIITLIGAGGKTSTLQALTKEVNSKGKPVIATTTTKVYPMEMNTMNTWKNPDDFPPIEVETPCFWYADMESDEGIEGENKWVGPSKEAVDKGIREELDIKTERSQSRVWLIEGDGARGKNLKCWDYSYEPQIPKYTRCGVLVIRGDLWDKVLTEEDIHRENICPSLLGKVWDAEQAAKYLLNSPVFHANYSKFSWVVLFNHHDSLEQSLEEEKLKELQKFISNLRNNHLQKDNNTEKQNEVADSANTIAKASPKHLRIATGNVKEDKVQWYDLW